YWPPPNRVEIASVTPASASSAPETPSTMPLSGGVGSCRSGMFASASRASSAPVTVSTRPAAASSSPASSPPSGSGGGGGGGLSRNTRKKLVSSGASPVSAKCIVSLSTYCTSVAVMMSATNVTG